VSSQHWNIYNPVLLYYIKQWSQTLNTNEPYIFTPKISGKTKSKIKKIKINIVEEINIHCGPHRKVGPSV